ncbi:putative OsmC-related protein [Proteiniphilum saccharofermentans]|uniref:Putative OsmC-related protein n=1 Tax=Proteiniphilum saccharofermentans TaxID=1642647 RepID=A0A1R3SSQ6_9BACT|nr:OsmC family protein [Proteiniphilum saccharofermentans]SCD19373.1 putative OsmC-related protein [Proteiniphilum saccharofermentans]
MAMHSIQTVWRKNNIFDTEIDGHKITIDLAEEAGGNDEGPRPKRLLLIAAAGCTGLDVVEIVRKMRIDLKSFDIRIDAEMSEEHPKQYTSLKVIYEFEGDNLPKEKLERACKLSFDNYCGVLAMYKKAVPVTCEVVIKNS